MEALDLRGGGDGITNEDGRGELPVLAQEDRPGTGHVHRHEGMK